MAQPPITQTRVATLWPGLRKCLIKGRMPIPTENVLIPLQAFGAAENSSPASTRLNSRELNRNLTSCVLNTSFTLPAYPRRTVPCTSAARKRWADGDPVLKTTC